MRTYLDPCLDNARPQVTHKLNRGSRLRGNRISDSAKRFSKELIHFTHPLFLVGCGGGDYAGHEEIAYDFEVWLSNHVLDYKGWHGVENHCNVLGTMKLSLISLIYLKFVLYIYYILSTMWIDLYKHKLAASKHLANCDLVILSI